MPVVAATATVVADGAEMGGTLDLLDVVDSLSAHYHEHLDAILAWSWRLFCTRWVRMIEAEGRRLLRERAQQEARQEQQELAEQKTLLRQLQQQDGGGLGVDGW